MKIENSIATDIDEIFKLYAIASAYQKKKKKRMFGLTLTANLSKQS
jgi:hypothetical protein